MQHTARSDPQAMLDPTSPRPAVRRGPLVVLLVWCAVEATFFAFLLRPTMSELVSDLAGFTVNPTVLVALLSVFLTAIVAGTFVGIQALQDAIRAKHIANIVSMVMVEIMVATFQVLFLHRAVVDGMIPWVLAQGVILGDAAAWALASLLWVGVRGMTWYLFGRVGAPALIAALPQAGTQKV